MLSKQLTKQFTDIARSLRKEQDAFVRLYNAACIEVGGKQWQKKKYAEYFAMVDRELVALIVGEGLLTQSVARAYLHAAKVALLFGVPFSVASRCRAKYLPDVQKAIAIDTSEDAAPVKFARAVETVRQKEQNDILQPGKFAAVLPQRLAGESMPDFERRLGNALSAYFATIDDKHKFSPAAHSVVLLATALAGEQKSNAA